MATATVCFISHFWREELRNEAEAVNAHVGIVVCTYIRV